MSTKKPIKTDMQAKNIQPAAKDERYLIDGCTGLFLRVRSEAEGGGKTWIFRYSFAGKDGRVTLGRYPEMSLASARAKALEKRLETQKARQGEGDDPATQRARNKREQAQRRSAELLEPTVRDLYLAWGGRPADSKTKARKDGGKELRRIMDKDVLPFIGDRKVKDIAPADIRRLCHDKRDGTLHGDKKEKRTTFIQGRILSYLRQMFEWAIGEGGRYSIEINPTAGVRNRNLGIVNAKRDRNLSFTELAALRDQLPTSGLPAAYQAAICLYLATGVRLEELIEAQWGHIDFQRKTWLLPDTKNGTDHTVYLSAFALRQLSILQKFTSGPYLMEGRKSGAIKDKRAFARTVRDRIETDPAKSRAPNFAGKLALAGGDWTIHDLRRTCESRMCELGVPSHTAHKCTNHKERGTQAIYQHYDYAKEMRQAFEKWGRELDRLWLGTANSAQVVEFGERRSG